jgi:ParB/RepB/Spo0J family partition protein
MTEVTVKNTDKKTARKSKSGIAAKKHIAVLKNVLDDARSNTPSRIKGYREAVGRQIVANIPIEDIELNENIRETIATENSKFKALLESIKSKGILQNITVEFRDSGNDYKIVCVAGHRRVTAAKIAGLITIPAVVTEALKPETRMEIMLVENLVRADLHCLEIAEGYKELLNSGWSRKKICERFGKKDRTVHSYIKMGEWPQQAKNFINGNPDKFPARILIHKVACKRFHSEGELMSLLRKIADTNSPNKKKGLSKKEETFQILNKFIKTKRYKKEVRDGIHEAFSHLNLTPPGNC